MKLRLGPTPDTSSVKITVSIPAPLKIQLELYAEMHSREFSKAVDAQTLVPLMLATFLARDRAFQRAARSDPRNRTIGNL